MSCGGTSCPRGDLSGSIRPRPLPSSRPSSKDSQCPASRRCPRAVPSWPRTSPQSQRSWATEASSSTPAMRLPGRTGSSAFSRTRDLRRSCRGGRKSAARLSRRNEVRPRSCMCTRRSGRSEGARSVTAAALERDLHHETYDYWRYQGRDWRWFERLFHRIRPVPPVLDVGSGLGFFVECCLRNGARAVGIELSREGIAASAQRRLPVVRGDLTLPFPFRDDAFGSALAHHVLEHVPLAMERRILREIRRVLRPGGSLFVASPCLYPPRATEDPDHINL